ncbi:hypothetical protein PAMP_006914 [Pampus punctatissimus]
MKSSAPLLSPPPSPHHAPLPLPSSSLMCCPELDLSVTLSPPSKTDQTHLMTRPRGQTGKRNTQVKTSLYVVCLMTSFCSPDVCGFLQVCFEEPLGITVKKEPHIPLSSDEPQQPISSQKRRGGHHGGSPKQSVWPLAIVSNENPGCLEKAGLNTTLALKAELQSLGRSLTPRRPFRRLYGSQRGPKTLSTPELLRE